MSAPFRTPQLEVHPHEPERPSLVLTPIDQQSLGCLLPFDSESKATMSVYDQAAFDSAKVAWEVLTGPTQYLWGMHMRSTDGGRLLVGLAISEQSDPTSVSVGHFITRPEGRRKGLGTLSKLAIAAYMFQRPEISTLEAATLDINGPSQISLARAGFVEIPCPDGPYTYGYGADGKTAQLTAWALFRPDHAVTALGIRRAVPQEDIGRSQAVYLAALSAVDIVMPKPPLTTLASSYAASL